METRDRRRRRTQRATVRAAQTSVATMLTTSAVVVLALALCTADNGSSGPSPEATTLNTTAVPTGNELNDTLPAEQYFIDKIFDKYGDKGVITFEVGAIFFISNVRYAI